MEPFHVIVVTLVFVLAGGVKGITGMGLPTVAVSLLGLWMTPTQAAALLVAPSLATNVAQCRGPRLRKLVSMLWPAWSTLAAVTVLAPDFGKSMSVTAPRDLLGVVLVAYGLWGLWRPTLPALPARASFLGAGIGAATGLVTASTAVFVVPFVPYLQAMRLGKDEMVQALGLSFTVATLALAVRLQASGELTVMTTPTFVALVAAFVGLWLGSVVRDRISVGTFQRSLFVVFVGLGIANVLRGH
jgi:uncharacterized membrane protein YfcA